MDISNYSWKQFLTLIICVCFIIVLRSFTLTNVRHIPFDDMYFHNNGSEEQDDYSEDNVKYFPADQTKYPLFQSNVAAEFPTIVNTSCRIPHIIHQIFSNENVPKVFQKPMRSFILYNPTWEYRFWTYSSGRNFLIKHHAYLLDFYDKIGENDVKRSDLLRMAIIYEFGGVYADLDVENLRSLNITTTKYACIIPPEPFEHSGILYGEEVIIATAVLLCRPKHPFIKQILLSLQHADPNGDPVSTTGPEFITHMYLKYNNITKSDLLKSVADTTSNSPYFYKGTRDEDSQDGIYIPNSQYFMDNVDPMLRNEDGEIKECVDKSLDALSFLEKRACTEFESRKTIRKEKHFTFTIHYWFHLWTYTDSFAKKMPRIHIKQIIPKAISF